MPMRLSVEGPGKKVSPYTDIQSPSFVASVPPQSAKYNYLETEHCFDRPDSFEMPRTAHNHDSSQEAPTGLGLGTDLYQVHLPDWHSRYTTCMKHFLDQAQYSAAVQSLAAYINIRLPYQRPSDPVTRFHNSDTSSWENKSPSFQVSLRHYLRRLIVTGNDTPPILEAFFGAGWFGGVGCIWKQERINYLFTAKSVNWAKTKAAYDILPDEHTPFLRPIQGTTEQELNMANAHWSEHLAMEDWMVGPRCPF
ncbi:hypothetical protein BDW59DRAFT_141804 [Aspergillus cavernicola]|uniref:Uncharacterized protein n=1 Tax=Aspergillus cavernicola TaxID=176166 RepID=A0ABR4IS44_9EURO